MLVYKQLRLKLNFIVGL